MVHLYRCRFLPRGWRIGILLAGAQSERELSVQTSALARLIALSSVVVAAVVLAPATAGASPGVSSSDSAAVGVGGSSAAEKGSRVDAASAAVTWKFGNAHVNERGSASVSFSTAGFVPGSVVVLQRRPASGKGWVDVASTTQAGGVMKIGVPGMGLYRYRLVMKYFGGYQAIGQERYLHSYRKFPFHRILGMSAPLSQNVPGVGAFRYSLSGSSMFVKSPNSCRDVTVTMVGTNSYLGNGEVEVSSPNRPRQTLTAPFRRPATATVSVSGSYWFAYASYGTLANGYARCYTTPRL